MLVAALTVLQSERKATQPRERCPEPAYSEA